MGRYPLTKRELAACSFWSGVCQTRLSTPGVLPPLFLVTLRTASNLAKNDFERRCIRAFALPQRFSLTALAMRLCSLLTDWMTLRHCMVAQLSVWCGSAHDEFASSFICFLSLTGSVKLLAIKHQLKVSGLSPRDDVSTTIRLITNRPSLVSTSLSDVSQCLTVMVLSLLFTRNRWERAPGFHVPL